MSDLPERTTNQLARLLNGQGHRHSAEVSHLAIAAARSVDSLIYLADIDNLRFGGTWPSDSHANDCVDDGHVRWATAGALASLDHCMAAASRFGGFAESPPQREDSVRTFYSVSRSGTVNDKRSSVLAPWRAWIEGLIGDPRYARLLEIRNALIHADVFRTIYGTSGPLVGHGLRFGYRLGTFGSPTGNHYNMRSREIIELSRDTAVIHVNAFVEVLESIP